MERKRDLPGEPERTTARKRREPPASGTFGGSAPFPISTRPTYESSAFQGQPAVSAPPGDMALCIDYKAEYYKLRTAFGNFRLRVKELEEVRDKAREIRRHHEESEDKDKPRVSQDYINWLSNGEKLSETKSFLNDDLSNSVLKARHSWDERHDYQYKRVKVLLVSWKSEIYRVDINLPLLMDLFSRYYRYETETYQIPDSQPSSNLTSRVLQFIGDSSASTLLIFYYIGHGSIDAVSNTNYWAANAHGGPPMPVSGIQTLFEENRSDAVLFYDSCRAANTPVTKLSDSGSTELIAASGFRSVAIGAGEGSLLNAVIQVFQTAYQQNSWPLSVPKLFTQILARDRTIASPRHRSTPVHCTLTSGESGRRIMLQPLSPPASERPGLITGTMVVTMGIGNDVNFDTEGWANDWKKWILSAPPDAKKLLGIRVLKTIEEDSEIESDEPESDSAME